MIQIFPGQPPQHIIDEALDELAALAEEVDIDANWNQNPEAVEKARVFSKSYLTSACMAWRGWPFPQRMEAPSRAALID